MANLIEIYNYLYDMYGPQGWWPVLKYRKGGYVSYYHKSNYSYPRNKNQVFEICIGAILTQNTAWKNVEKALANLADSKLIDPEKIHKADINKLKQAIRPAGYYNQKSAYLKFFTKFYLDMNGKPPTRKEILSVKGIGPETADSILLYAYNLPEFVIDAYTKKIFSAIGLIDKSLNYHKVKELFENNLPKDVLLYQEYHALIVEHAKNYYSRVPKECPLVRLV